MIWKKAPTASLALVALLLTGVASLSSYGQSNAPKFEVDPSWPKPLPNNWTTGQVGGVCVDGQDNVFIVNRQNLTDKELLAAQQAPPIIEFNPEGKVVNSFGTKDTVPKSIHGCTV